MTEPPFGAYAPSPLQRWAIARGRRLRPGAIGKQLASLYKRLARARARRPVDVELFDGLRARLHAYDNSCERRVLCTPQFWDSRERAFIADHIAHSANAAPFQMIDIGANAGLYTLFVAAELARRGQALRAVLMEPEPVMRRRLEFNLAVNGLTKAATVLPWAACRQSGRLRLAPSHTNRGETAVVCAGAPERHGGAIEIDGRTVLEALDAGGLAHLDFLKIDIEGGEYDALEPFFENAPPARWPRMILIETFHEAPGAGAADLCRAAGYRAALATKLNTVFLSG